MKETLKEASKATLDKEVLKRIMKAAIALRELIQLEIATLRRENRL